MDCWKVAGTKTWTNSKKTIVYVKKEEKSGRPREKTRIETSVEARKEDQAEDHSKSSIGVYGMSKAQIEQGFKDLADVMRQGFGLADAMMQGFGMCFWEMKLLGDRFEAMEKKVGITKKATASNEL
ncbi:hypothetical protein Bca4012_082941 [Brassica carinata]